MLFTYSDKANVCHSQGLIGKKCDQSTLYVSNEKPSINSINELAHSEYQIGIEVDSVRRKVRFGRDYLGHCPLYYASTRHEIIISDEMSQIISWLNQRNITTTVSETAVALFLSMGYVPQDYTLYKEIHSCRNTSLYEWDAGQVTHSDLFTPVSVDPDCEVADIGVVLESEIDQILADEDDVQVWCSGGLDSSIIAMLCNRKGRSVDLLTLEHIGEFRQGFGDGELPFAIELQNHLNTNLHKVEFSPASFNNSFYNFLSLHPTPVLDPVVTPKYMLARKTRSLGLTGEGGDPLFAGVKNNTVCYMQEKNPGLSPGIIYALAHQRFYNQLPKIMKNGRELADVVDRYLLGLWDKYPGTALRKLFYMNTLEKQGGMIFPKNYFAAKYGGVRVRHPLTSLRMYNTAFALDDGLKYRYPHGKLALTSLYGKQLPEAIVNRRKSGTLVPMNVLLKNIHSGQPDFTVLTQSGLFDEESLHVVSQQQNVSQMDNCSVFLIYALSCLTKWLESNGGNSNATANISIGASNL